MGLNDGQIFEGAVVGRWNVLARQPNRTGIEVVETVLGNQRKELSANSASFPQSRGESSESSDQWCPYPEASS